MDSSQPNKLLLSYIRPHKPISSVSLSKWQKDLISRAGIDTSIFKTHSVRGASSSDAYEMSVSLQDILDLADWSTDSTFQHFYYKPRHNANVAKTLLNTDNSPICFKITLLYEATVLMYNHSLCQGCSRPAVLDGLYEDKGDEYNNVPPTSPFCVGHGYWVMFILDLVYC